LWRRRKHIVLIRRHCVWKLYTEINDLRNKMLPTYKRLPIAQLIDAVYKRSHFAVYIAKAKRELKVFYCFLGGMNAA